MFISPRNPLARQYWWIILCFIPVQGSWMAGMKIANDAWLQHGDGHSWSSIDLSQGNQWVLWLMHFLDRYRVNGHMLVAWLFNSCPSSEPIGSMYAIYGNIYHQYTPNVSIYTIHGSYGELWPCTSDETGSLTITEVNHLTLVAKSTGRPPGRTSMACLRISYLDLA